MRHRPLLIVGAGFLVALMFGLNLVGAQLNRLFLAYPGIDKVLHFAFHVPLFFCLRALASFVTTRPRSQMGLAAAAGLALAMADEGVQSLNANRSVEVADLIADLGGILLAWTIAARPRALVAAGLVAAAAGVAGYVAYGTHLHLRDFNRAVQYEEQRDFVRAREYYRRAFESGLRTPALYNELGWVEIESGVGDARKAVEYAETALKMDPRNPDVHDTYAWALLHAGRAAEALPYFLTALAQKPTMFCIHYHLGRTYQALGRPDQARVHFRQQLAFTGTREASLAKSALAELGERP